MINIKGWLIATHASFDEYLYISRDGAPGSITIKAEGEGFVVDVYSDDADPELKATTYALYTELEPE